MANRDPSTARHARALKRLSNLVESDIVVAEKALWSAVLEIVARLDKDINNNDLSKLTNTLARACAEIRGIRADGELTRRLEALEQAMNFKSGMAA